ncbi:MAG: sugar phosphate isomerase/epimerase family protein [Prevotella sp.]
MKFNLCLSALMALTLAMPANVSAAGKLKPKKEISVQLYSVRSILDGVNQDGNAEAKYIDILHKLASMGYTSVEAANYDQGRGTFYGRTPAQFKSDVEKAGMRVLSSHTGHGLSSEELASGDFTPSLNWWRKCIADHKAAGMKYIVCPWMDVPKTLKDLATYCRYYNEVGRMCKAEGMAFGYHNHAHEFQDVEGKKMYDFMLENTDPDLVLFEMDLYWAVRGQVSPVDYFNCYPGRFKLFHVKDDKEIGQSGMVGFDAIFRNADKAGLENAIIEVEQYSMPVEESVKVSIDYLLESSFVKKTYNKK